MIWRGRTGTGCGARGCGGAAGAGPSKVPLFIAAGWLVLLVLFFTIG